MSSNHIVGTRYISSAPHTRLIFGILTVILSAFFLGFRNLYAQEDSTILYPGTYQAEDAQVRLPEDAKIVNVEGAEFGKVVEGYNGLDFAAYGTDIIVRWKNPFLDGKVTGNNTPFRFPGDTLGTKVIALIMAGVGHDDGKLIVISRIPTRLDDNGWFTSTLAHATVAQEFYIQLYQGGVGAAKPDALQIDSITVLDRTFENIFPYIAAIGITIGMTLFVVMSALRERWSNR